MRYRLFTSESVTEGHPDKVCDIISDAILDEIFKIDCNARVACECAATTGLVVIMGEITANCNVDYSSIARKSIKEIGYDGFPTGFDYKTCAVLTSIGEQSADIALGVDSSFETKTNSQDKYDLIGAGDQGMVFGYACKGNDELMPAPIYYAHKLTKKLSEVRKQNILPFVLPDGKSQVTLQYGEAGELLRAEAIVVSTQHIEEIPLIDLRDAIMEEVILKTIPSIYIDKDTKIFINPTGRFVTGGPKGDSGLTGRKLIVDTYGGYARHGGGAFSGKDPTKVDRSASYMARFIAKNVVASGLAKEVEIGLAYAIGVARPVMVAANTFSSGILSDEKLEKLICECYDMRPEAIIENLNLRRPLYKQIAAYGHFGRSDIDLPWEDISEATKLYDLAK